MIPITEFLPRLKNYCLSLGFKQPIIQNPETPMPGQTLSGSYAELLFAENHQVIILSTRVPYEPRWGVYGGLPRPLIHERSEHHPEGTVSGYIAPYLQQYQFAQKHIYLACKEGEQYCITLPAHLAKNGKAGDGKNLQIILEKIAEADENGDFSPQDVSDTSITYRVSGQFLQSLREKGFTWLSGRGQRIGRFLTEDLFEFTEVTGEDASQSEFVTTLLPVMKQIVTNEHPHLQAALCHLQSLFIRTVDEIQKSDRRQDYLNLLCLAGLDIDVAAFKGRGKRYFVPYAAYRQQGRTEPESRKQLKQDELFVALMAQKKHCLLRLLNNVCLDEYGEVLAACTSVTPRPIRQRPGE